MTHDNDPRPMGWIAAIATAHGLPIVTQDGGFDALQGAKGVTVIRV